MTEQKYGVEIICNITITVQTRKKLLEYGEFTLKKNHPAVDRKQTVF